MTRFARAKGSKASNERLPEQATAWSEMKQQLLQKNKEIAESKNRKEAINQRNANYKAFLDKKEEDEIKNSKWADFPGMSNFKHEKKSKLTVTNSVQKNHQGDNEQNSSEDETFTLLKNKVDKILDNENPNKGEEEIKTSDHSDSDAPPEKESAKKEIAEPLIKIKSKKKKKKLLKMVVNKEDKADKTKSDHEEKSRLKKKRKATENEDSTIRKRSFEEISVVENGNQVIKNKKRKQTLNQNTIDKIKQETKITENLSDIDLRKIEKKKQKKLRQLESRRKKRLLKKKQKEEEINGEQDVIGGNKVESQESNVSRSFPKEQYNNSNNVNKEKKAKVRDKETHPRRKPFLPNKMIINGKELIIDYVDGFPVKKEDAVRLKKLRKEMISKGLPRSEINVALKLERRRAEKAFANEKKKVCFHCRESGHNLSECPKVDNNQIAQTAVSGICFKCGSTEHTHFECKVVRGQDYKFAQCFICNEQGHIARQCPDNARGLYPKGGGCNMCGDVTHLKRDCPKYQAQQQRQEENLKIETFGDSNPDVMEEKSGNIGRILDKKPNKIIKF